MHSESLAADLVMRVVFLSGYYGPSINDVTFGLLNRPTPPPPITIGHFLAYPHPPPKSDVIYGQSLMVLVNPIFSPGVKTLLVRQNGTRGVSNEDDEGSESGRPSPAKKMKLKEYSGHLAEDFQVGLNHRDATIDKWNDKTQLAAASR